MAVKRAKKKKREISPEKRKDMIKSILPSKRRKTSFQNKRAECHHVRRNVNQALNNCDEEGYTDRDLTRLPYQSRNVDDRRAKDKLNHFYRWAFSHTEGMSEQDALSYIRKLLPRDVIGDHAYSHWTYEVKRRYKRRLLFL